MIVIAALSKRDRTVNADRKGFSQGRRQDNSSGEGNFIRQELRLKLPTTRLYLQVNSITLTTVMDTVVSGGTKPQQAIMVACTLSAPRLSQ